MICPGCNKDWPEFEFYGKEQCYKCIYAFKTKTIKKVKICPICKKEVPAGRWIYCNNDCAYISQRRKIQEQKKRRSVKSQRLSFNA